jgi:hypothetical protein
MDLAVVTVSKPKCHMTTRPRPWCGVGPHKRGPFMTCNHCIKCSHVRMGLVQTVGGNLTTCMAHSSPRPSSPVPTLGGRRKGSHSRRAGLVSWARQRIHDLTPQHKSHTYTCNTLFVNVERGDRAWVWSADLGVGWTPRLGQGLQARVLTPREDPVHTSLMRHTPCFCTPLASNAYTYSCGVAPLGS